ncbi:hypothetical protein CA51_27340 [Rosistilla oblonga]|uniref:hypothetical protein n=1 Tax=Rosistilla oblonga TaxID=2527990 RepID=UPI00118940A2|nr:hypothetical protein [Rosistilla oblonga]QDV12848.1 hypothetical protein CA51_27340 [Rosistilla oblonga]
MALIRPFQNSDTNRLAVAWREHWHTVGPIVSTTSAQLEQAILDKPFFEFDHMLVIEEEGQLVGFSHLQTDPSDDPPIRARIASFCVGQCADRRASAAALLQASIDLSAKAGIREFEVGTVLGDLSGLVGLEPYSGVIGIPDSDHLMVELLTAAGFEPRTQMIAMELDLTSFRAPVDRELLLLRRMATIDERPQQLPTDWRAACAHSHFDITEFVVSNRTGQELASATFYLSDRDALVMDRGLLYLANFDDLSGNPLDVDLAAEVRYAVAGSLPSMVQRRFHTVRAIINSGKPSAPARIDFLTRLGFHHVAAGSAYHRTL